jgi:hypothetical protein
MRRFLSALHSNISRRRAGIGAVAANVLRKLGYFRFTSPASSRRRGAEPDAGTLPQRALLCQDGGEIDHSF